MRGIPVPKVMWFKDGNRLSSSENRYLIDSKGNGIHILKICDVKDQDHGIYSGTFSNSLAPHYCSLAPFYHPSGKVNVQRHS